MMKNVTAVLIFFLSIFLAASHSAAFQVNFTPRASTSMEYTDNIFLSAENEEDEFMTIVSAGFTLELLGKTNGLEITYDPSYVFYNEFSENDTLRHNAQLSAFSDIGRNTRLEITDRFLFTEDPLGESDLIRDDQVVIPGDTTIRRTRNEYYTNTAIMRLNHQFGPENNVYAQFLHSFLRNDDPTIEDNDRYEPSFGLTYWFGPKYGIETSGIYTKGKFSRDDDLGGDPSDDFDNWFGSLKLIRNMTKHFSAYVQYDHTYRDYDGINDDDYKIYAPSAGIDYRLGQDFRFALGLGYFHQAIDNDDNENGLFGSGEIEKNWNFRRGGIRLIGSAGLRQNDFGAQQLGLERFGSLTGNANYYFTRKFLGDITASFNYSNPVDTDESDGIEEQKSYAGGAGLSYFPLRWVALRLSYQYTRYDSDVESDAVFAGRTDDNYEENRVMFMVVLQADPPWRF
jgi:hypothetical protein